MLYAFADNYRICSVTQSQSNFVKLVFFKKREIFTVFRSGNLLWYLTLVFFSDVSLGFCWSLSVVHYDVRALIGAKLDLW